MSKSNTDLFDSTFFLEQGEATLPNTTRPVIYSKNSVISSGHYLTSMAGMRMLISGGNAFDALVASTFAAAVVEPIAAYSIGAEATFMLYHAESGDFLSLSGQGVSPQKASIDFFKSEGHDTIPTGPGKDAPLSFTVPGVVAASLSLLEKYGTMTVQDVLSPALDYSKNGIPNYEYMVDRLGAGDSSQFNLFPPGGNNIFFNNGELPKPGTLLIQKSLGLIFEKMTEESLNFTNRKDSILAARKSFYEGEIADLIIKSSEKVGGILTKKDLAEYKEEYSIPVKTEFYGYEIHGHSTWSQGPVVQQTLNILENFDLAAMGHNSTLYIHVITESLKLAFADREAFYGDPNFSDIPIDGLLSKEYAMERSKLIDLKDACRELPNYGDPWKYSRLTGKTADQPEIFVEKEEYAPDEKGTTHITVMDNVGNIVCATPSGGAFNKSVFFDELGFAISTRSEMFNFVEGHPNMLIPGKRPRTTIINFMITKDSKPIATVGCPGGDAQTQANLQLILNTIVWKMNPQESSEAPRFSTLSVPNSFYPHTYFPNQLSMEDGFSDEVKKGLEKLGHQLIFTPTCGMGATVAIKDLKTSILAVGADPRRACYAMGL